LWSLLPQIRKESCWISKNGVLLELCVIESLLIK
jgi:hypothetical protein